MPIGPISPGLAVTVTPDDTPAPYASITASTAGMPVASAADVQALALNIMNAANSSVNFAALGGMVAVNGSRVFVSEIGWYQFFTVSGFTPDAFWVVAGIGGQWVHEHIAFANLGHVAAMGTVPGGILTAAANTIPYSTANVTRSKHTMHVGDPSRWDFLTNGILQQFSVTGQGFLVVELDLPHNAILQSVTLTLKAAGGHGALPASKPAITLWESTLSAGLPVTFGGNVDPSANVAAYELLHTISVNALGHAIDNANKRYTLQIDGEAGANSVLGLAVYGVTTVCTVTEQDKG